MFEACLSGVILALGMQFYYAMLVTPALIIILWAHDYFYQKSTLKNHVPILAYFLLGLFITYAPIINFATYNWKTFNQRVGTVSIIKINELSDIPTILLGTTTAGSETREKIISNLNKHLSMFHLAGDRNGRHNLPGAPMLDIVSGVALIIGLLFSFFLQNFYIRKCALKCGEKKFRLSNVFN